MLAERYRSLNILVGQPLSEMWRYANFQRFEFGTQYSFINRKGEKAKRSDLLLDVSCQWLITHNKIELLSASDYVNGKSARAIEASWFFNVLKNDPPCVTAVYVNEKEDLTIELDHGFILYILPATQKISAVDKDEQWCFMQPRSSLPELVVW